MQSSKRLFGYINLKLDEVALTAIAANIFFFFILSCLLLTSPTSQLPIPLIIKIGAMSCLDENYK
jgi:hypothetical protein